MDMRKKESKDLLQRVKDRFKLMSEADEVNRRRAMEDLKFVNVPGSQWDENMKQERGDRPCYEFNKLRISGKRIINDMRANRPQGKVRAVENGDKEQADLREGLTRNIWNISDGDTIIDNAAEYQVNAGMAAWRVITEYSDDTAFDQDIKVSAIQNPFCLYCDPAAKDFLKRDAEDWILTEKISEDEFEERWPKADKTDFQDAVEFDDEDWNDEDMVRVAEYWYKKPHKKELWLVETDNGPITVDSESDEGLALAKQGFKPSRVREVMTDKICWCIASSDRILEKGVWAGHHHPFIMIYGEYVYVDGRCYWWGLPRFAKDAQRSYNIARTAISETIAQAPKSFIFATQKQVEGHTDQWNEAHKKNFPFLYYNSDPTAGGAPQRIGGADVPVALIQETQIASDEIKAVTGIYDASLGNQSNEKSGRAIYARQQQGEIATFNYQDNMAKGIQRTWEIILDLIPEIYDTERELRIIGSDGAEDYRRINQTVVDLDTGREVRVNDMSAGKYDVAITVGPNFATLRQEAAETYGAMAQQFPELMGFAGDLVMKSMDLPYAEDIAERIKAMLPPPVQKMISKDTKLPPEAMQAMQQADQAMQQVQEYGRLVQDAAAELEQEKGDNEKLRSDIKVDIANLKAQKAEFDAHIAEETAKLVQQSAGLTEKQAGLVAKGAELREQSMTSLEQHQDLSTEGLDVAQRIDSILAEFMTAVDQAISDMRAKDSEIERAANKQPVSGTTRREGGKLIADIEYDDGTTRSVTAQRENGDLKLVP